MIEFTSEQIERAESLLSHIPGAMPKAMKNATNRAMQSAKTEASRKVRETYYIKNKDVTSTIRAHRASISNLSARIVSKGNLLALSKFKVTPKTPQPKRKRAIIARVKRGEGGPVRGAFVASMNSGHTGVFKRAGLARLPVTELYGPAVPQMMDNQDVREHIEEKAVERFNQRLDHEINRILER